MYSNLPPPESCGWLHNTNRTYTIDWEDPEIEDRIRGTVVFLIKGCTCKKGCSSTTCKCMGHKKESYRGSACECQGHINIPLQRPLASSTDISDSEDILADTVEPAVKKQMMWKRLKQK